MLGTHAFVTVWQQEGKSVHGPPLVLSCTQKLVEQDLSTVIEIAELRLPNGQAIGRGEGVSVVKTGDRILTQKRVENGELGLLLVLVLWGREQFLEKLKVSWGVSSCVN